MVDIDNIMIHTLKDFLPEDLSCRIRDILMGDSFPYFYRDGVSYEGDDNYCFGHTLFNDDDDYPDDCIINPDYSKLFNQLGIPLVSRISMSRLLRMKINCYPRQTKIIADRTFGGMHVDFERPHVVGIYCVNTNNGYTLFEDGTECPSIANTMYIFDGSMQHSCVHQTDENIRVNINMDWED